MARTRERRAVGVTTSPSVIKRSGIIIIHSAHVKMASTSRPEEPDSDASVPQPCLISLSLVNSCFESLSPAAIFGSCRECISLLKHSFSDTQNASLQDLIETSLILQYNQRDV